MTPLFRPRHAVMTGLLLASLAGCNPPAAEIVTSSATLVTGPLIEGQALVPAELLSNNGAGIISNNGSMIVAPGTSRYALLALGDELPLPEALVYLTDPKDNFLKANGKTISTTTNARGEYKLRGSVPKGVPVIVNAVLNGNRRVVGFTVPVEGAQRVDLSVASNFVTEFLRARAEREQRSMAEYDLKQLPGLVTLTSQALKAGSLNVPDLDVGHIASMNQAYALAVGTLSGLGDAWQKLLGRRVLALQTVAGSGEAAASGDGGAATRAGLYRPRIAIADGQGHLYIADEGNQRIRRVDAKTGLITTVAGTGEAGFSGDGGPATEAKLRDPRTLALDSEGNLYIGDEGNARVRRVDADTNVITTVVGAPDEDGAGGWVGGHSGDGGPAVRARIYMPRGLVFDAMNNLYIADSQNGTHFATIRKVDTHTGIITTVAGIPDETGFSGDGGQADAAKLKYPNQLAIDAKGRLLIADTDNHCVRRVDLETGVISTIAGIGGQQGQDPDGKLATETRLDAPYGVAAAPDGRVFISERGAGRIRLIGADGKLTTLAGGGTNSQDGESLLVQLTQPHDLFVEKDGNLLIADTRGSRVRRLVLKNGL